MEKILKATHGSNKTKIVIGDIQIPCYVLEDGTRVLSETGIFNALRITREGRRAGGKLPSFLGGNSVAPFVSEDLRAGVMYPIKFTHNGTNIYGIKATMIPQICEVWLRAKEEHMLSTKKQRETAKRAEILTRAFAKIGIIALVDEVTGYIADKRKHEYIELFRQFIRDTAMDWEKEFPDVFFDMLYKLYGKEKPLKVKNHPQYFGNFIRKYVYRPLADSNGIVLDLLDEKNPKIENKSGNTNRKYKHFQFLERIGSNALRQHLWQLIGIGRSSETKTQFQRNFTRAFPCKNEQTEMELVGSGDDK